MEIDNFDPCAVGQDNGNYFGMPFDPRQTPLVLMSVPWDVTASYGGGAGFGPDAIIGASTQLDFHDPFFPGQWEKGIGTLAVDYSIQDASTLLRKDAVRVIKHLEQGGRASDDAVRRKAERINAASQGLNEKIYSASAELLAVGQTVGLVGGDHSTPFGLIKAVSEHWGDVSVLHIDAHADLRTGYEGFDDSHASIMYNVATRLDGVTKLVQVGVRDYCENEAEFARANPKIDMFDSLELSRGRFGGMTWDAQCEDIVGRLGGKVYVSFDIDGLTPENCPNTGTPVPGGLSFDEAVWLIYKLAGSGREIVGFDLCEVAPGQDNEWDANVGARMLFKLCGATLSTKNPQP